MTVSSATNKSGPYTGNGVTTVFAYGFRILDASHIKVVRTENGADTVLTTGFTVSGVGNAVGGNVTFAVAPTAAQKITLIRNAPFTQQTDLENQGAYYAETVEEAFDLAAMRDQQLKEEVDRSLRLPASAANGVNVTLPVPERNSLIGWNEDGTALQNVDSDTLVTVVAFGTMNADTYTGDGFTTVFTLTDNPGAQANLDVSVNGLTLVPAVDYTWSAGTNVTFSVAPGIGDEVLIRYSRALPQGAADAAAVSTAYGVTVARLLELRDGTVADLLADTTLTYPAVAAGDVVEAGGFRYQVAASGASDHHVTTAGGVKLYVLPGASGYNVKAFGAVGDGVANDSAPIAAAFAAGNAILFPSGTFLMNAGVTKLANNIKVDFRDAKIINGGVGFLFTFGATADTPTYTGLQIIGGWFEQSNPATSSNFNYIRVAATKDFSIRDTRMNNVSNGGIYVEAGCEDGVIDSVTVNGMTAYTPNRGIWLNGSTASDYAAQLVDTNSITRNATAVPANAVKNVRVSNCTVALPGYGIYLMNARDCTIEKNYVDVSGAGADRCIAINNYSPGSIIRGNTLISDRSSTGILVTQASDNVIITNNVFKGSFGGNRAIYVAYLASALISDNRFTDTTTQHIQIDMGGFAHVKNNEFVRSSRTADHRAVFLTAIDNSQTGTAVGSTATVLANSGVVFENNLLDRVCLGVFLRTDLAANNANQPAVGICQVTGNTFLDMDLAATSSEYPLAIIAGSGANVSNARMERNVVYPYTVSGRNSFASTGSAIIVEATTASFASFRVAVAAAGGSITSTRLAGNNFSLSVTRSGPNLILSPRTQLAAAGSSVPAITGIINANGATAVRTFQVSLSGSNYTVGAYDAAGTQISFATAGVTFDVLLGPIGVGT